MHRKIALGLIVSLLLTAAANRSAHAIDDITLEGGNTTVDDASFTAYDHVVPNMSDQTAELMHDIGQTGFLRNFGRVKIRGAIRLGPQFNAPSCASCHGGNGRGELRITRRRTGSDTVVKISSLNGKPAIPGGPGRVRRVGLQIRDHAVRGSVADARVSVSWLPVPGAFNNGTPYELRSPAIKITKSGRLIPSNTLRSLRRAPPVFGSGLLDAISGDSILANADPNDTNGDGISGRANVVWNVQTRTSTIGRFGFKAGSPTLLQQVAAAYATDMGVSNALFRVRHEKPEISSRILNATTFYSATLGIPRARNQSDPVVTRGRDLFTSLGCNACHTPTFTTGAGAHASLSYQVIHPFSDLLLHDMGDGLADGRPEFLATGTEWRTTPLWGIGLAETVLKGKPATYLHDGRARTLEEAILWHGGEASTAQNGYKTLAASDRDALIQFLRSL